MEALSRAYGDEALTAFELDFLSNGERRKHALGASWQVPFEAVEPVRPFRWDKGTPGFAGWYYSTTVRDHVGYESWLERDRLILLDKDPQVRAISSQPFWLHWHDGKRRRRHAPDYFVRLATGQARIVDVRAEDDMDEDTRESFAVTQRACAAVGWEFEWAGRPQPILMANVRWLARYRRARCGRPEAVVERLLEVFSEPRRLWDGAALVGDRIQVLPVLFHLLWLGKLKVDLSGGLLKTGSLVWAKGRRQWTG
ncbi:TnsA-like heteromeric transposase endonuclease subunit [Streptomyces sp. NBC_01142]|uniref:TnsA-like heteromeric transposase endonuclease subunit n=1 Tax=Streptomyces sp. NBC_01142 TaxID=2975865 RepID=UPI00224F282F|nr:TnsA-like heteromeric transposase endonuclease subunit [Streptomyces sp. NBC_01142]MCX4821622.1 TnsA-like heteromeric transposase endonuclease subunit [Streptomyces sp. NBC_01142]MCX4827045.1 TnsA-like heteromeric transposase endonuclease subunit [Streptomyces sp. NBC_01142]